MMLNDYPQNQNIIRDNIFFLGVNNEVRSIGDFLSSNFKNEIKTAVQAYGASILMIDPLISFHSQDENSNDQMRALLDTIGLFSEEINVTPLIIHHHAKFTSGSGPGGGRGASAIGDWSPNTWELDFQKKKGFKLVHNKARNFQRLDQDLPLELDKNTLRFKIKQTPTAHGSNVQKVVQALTNLGGQARSQAELKKKIMEEHQNATGSTIVENTAKKKIEEAVTAGAIKESKDGVNKIYSLP
jgi:hypothetical protein